MKSNCDIFSNSILFNQFKNIFRVFSLLRLVLFMKDFLIALLAILMHVSFGLCRITYFVNRNRESTFIFFGGPSSRWRIFTRILYKFMVPIKHMFFLVFRHPEFSPFEKISSHISSSPIIFNEDLKSKGYLWRRWN